MARPPLVRCRNRHVTHSVNAMLNYAYAVLESQARIATVSQGLVPTIGYLHACRPGRVALVYDLMEPLRPHVDRSALGFVDAQTFRPSDFLMENSGLCRLHPQLARRVSRLAQTNGMKEESASQLVSKLQLF